MFSAACSLYRQCLCIVAGSNAQAANRPVGTGVLISKKHVLTAAHNLRILNEQGLSPVFFKFDGSFKWVTQFQDNHWDVAILEAADRIKPLDGAPPADFPRNATRSLDLGMTLGYMTWLRKSFAGSRLNYFFSTGHTAFLPEFEEGKLRFVLTDGFIESGFSGGPAFFPDCSLAGVVVSSVTLPQIIQADANQQEISRVFPCVTTVPTLDSALLQDIQDAGGTWN